MTSKSDQTWSRSVQTFAFLALILLLRSASAQEQQSTPKSGSNIYQTLYLGSLTQHNDANDIVTDLRNMLPKSKVYFVPSQNAVSVLGTPEDIQLAQKILSDIDRAKKAYRLTYSITETDGGKQLGMKRYALVVASGGETMLKQGTKVPVVTGWTNDGTPSQNSQVQYLDVGLNIDASLEGYSDGLRLRTKIEQSSVGDEKSGIGTTDPVIRQTTLEGTSTLVQGKPLVVGAMDVPGSTRRQEIEVVSELVK
jgi:type II secretory pathway component GspD/PulD (secretin)